MQFLQTASNPQGSEVQFKMDFHKCLQTLWPIKTDLEGFPPNMTCPTTMPNPEQMNKVYAEQSSVKQMLKKCMQIGC